MYVTFYCYNYVNKLLQLGKLVGHHLCCSCSSCPCSYEYTDEHPFVGSQYIGFCCCL